MPPKLLALALLPLFAAGAFAVALLYYDQGDYEPPPSVDIPFEQITSPAVAPLAVEDLAVARSERGLVVIDDLHINSFAESEIATLILLVANRGYDVEIIDRSSAAEKQTELELLEEKLRRAASFAVMLPRTSFSPEEVRLVERFVEKGGKLLLVSDPTRPSRINELAKAFGVEFQPDYLYNTVEYDLNFRHIFVRDFQPAPLTSGLDTLVLYVAGSIRSSGPGLAVSDANTLSSLGETADSYHPIAWGSTSNVLAISDFTFVAPPYNSLLSNGRLLSNVADFLTDSQRDYELADFPHFYESSPDDTIDILLGDDSLWDLGLEMKNGLAGFGLSAGIVDEEDLSRNTAFLGLYEDSRAVSQYLQAAGVSAGESLSLPFAPDLDRDGTSALLLHKDRDRYVLVVMADSPDALRGAIGNLFSGEFRNGLVNEFLGLSKFDE